MESEVLRSLVFDALRDKPETQFVEVQVKVGELAHAKDLQRLPRYHAGADGRGNLTSADAEDIRQLIWELIIQGVLVPGMNDSNPAWPFIRVTSYGERVLSEGAIIPHDPDGYLLDLRAKVPAVDSLTEMYVSESLQCFLRGTYMASTVMLGVAAEATMLNLIAATAASIDDAEEKEEFEKVTKTWIISRKYNALQEKLPSFRNNLPREIEQDLEIMLNGCFTLIRNYRNETGHPTGRTIQHDECFANLQLFRVYCKRVYDLIGWLQENKI